MESFETKEEKTVLWSCYVFLYKYYIRNESEGVEGSRVGRGKRWRKRRRRRKRRKRRRRRSTVVVQRLVRTFRYKKSHHDFFLLHFLELQTASALAFLLYLLAKNESAQGRLVAEVDDVVGGRTPSSEDLQRMPFLKACVKETLRLFPPIPINARTTTEDCTLGGYFVPKDVSEH